VSILPEEIKVLSQFIYSLSGIALDESKGYLLESRLTPLLKQNNLATYSELYFKAKSDATRASCPARSWTPSPRGRPPSSGTPPPSSSSSTRSCPTSWTSAARPRSRAAPSPSAS